jgi:hypothetical protein
VVPMEVVRAQGADAGPFIGTPLIFQWIRDIIFGQLPPDTAIDLHPIAFAGWVGLLITALNLFPIGQLDGGHTLYALLGKKAHAVARLTWAGCFAAIVVSGNWGWSLMLGLLWMMGTDHPPTANDEVPLGMTRKIIGWALLLFVPIGFTPTPFTTLQPMPVQQQTEDGRIVGQQLLEVESQTLSSWKECLGQQLSAADDDLSDHRRYTQEANQTDEEQEIQRHRNTD